MKSILRGKTLLAVALMAVMALYSVATMAAGEEKPATDKEMAMQNLKDIVETAKESGQFSTLIDALQKADLVATLKGQGPFTLFAPTDAAFAKLPKDKLDALLANKDELKKVLLYHVVAGNIPAAQAMQLKVAKSVGGQALKIHAEEAALMIDNAKVTKADIKAGNGVIHVIDVVLMPKN